MSRTLFLAGLLCAVAACIWLLAAVGGEASWDGGTETPAPPAAGPPPALLAAAAAQDGSDASGPCLGVLRAPVRRDRGESVVAVLSPLGKPCAWMPVRITPADAPPAWRVTDNVGEIAFQDVALDGSALVEVFLGADAAPGMGIRVGAVRLRAARHEVHCRPALPLTATFVDAETGASLDGLAWRTLPAAADPAPAGSREATQLVCALPGDDLTDASASLGLAVDADLPRGYVAWDASSWQPRVSRYARALQMVYPLRREARVHVHAVEHDGTPTDRFEVCAFEIAGRRLTREELGEAWRTTPDADGVWLGGVPFFRERPLAVEACRPASPADEEVEIFEGRGAPDVAHGDGTLARVPEIPTRIQVRFPKDEGGVFFFGRGCGRTLGCACGDRARDVPRGGVVVQVLRLDGSPAAGAEVSCAGSRRHADFDGRVRFAKVRAGPTQVLLQEPGLVRTTCTVTVVADRVTTITLREAPGGTVALRVLAPDGEPVPFATVGTASLAQWVDLQDGVQRLDPYTDERGLRTLRRHPAGTWRFEARWAGLQGAASAEVVDGAMSEVVIRLAAQE